MSLELERERGARARRLLEDDLYRDSFAKLRAALQASWEHSRPDDKEARERAYLELRLLSALERDLETIMQTGEMAGRQIEARKK